MYEYNTYDTFRDPDFDRRMEIAIKIQKLKAEQIGLKWDELTELDKLEIQQCLLEAESLGHDIDFQAFGINPHEKIDLPRATKPDLSDSGNPLEDDPYVFNGQDAPELMALIHNRVENAIALNRVGDQIRNEHASSVPSINVLSA